MGHQMCHVTRRSRLVGPRSRHTGAAHRFTVMVVHKPVVGTGLGTYTVTHSKASCCTLLSAAGVIVLSVFGWGFSHNWETFMGSTDDPADGSAVGMTCYGAAFVYLLFILFCTCQMGVNRRYQRIQI